MTKLFEVSIDGLDEFRERFNQHAMATKVASGLSDVANRMVVAIDKSIKDVYAINRSPNTVLTKDIVNLVGSSDNKQHIDLIYAFEAIPLHEFPVKSNPVDARSRFKMVRGKTGKLAIVRQIKAHQALVKVKKTGGFKVVTGRKGYGGFLLEAGNNSKWKELQGGSGGTSYRKGVYERKFSDTWTTEPVDRSGRLNLLFGPSLSQMVATQMQESPFVARVINEMPAIMMGHLDL